MNSSQEFPQKKIKKINNTIKFTGKKNRSKAPYTLKRNIIKELFTRCPYKKVKALEKIFFL